jgi:hypothetical protein
MCGVIIIALLWQTRGLCLLGLKLTPYFAALIRTVRRADDMASRRHLTYECFFDLAVDVGRLLDSPNMPNLDRVVLNVKDIGIQERLIMT